MTDLLSTIYLVVCCLLCIPVGMFCIEIFVGSFARSKSTGNLDSMSMPKTVILIPAHNEEAVIESTLNSLLASGTENTEIIVIADNCSSTDTTADKARAAGVTVYERHHETDRGKGFALAYGLEKIVNAPPEVVIIVDADCIVSGEAINALAKNSVKTGHVYQSNYLITSKSDAPLSARVSQFAITIKNYVRMLGLSGMGSSVHLTGTGMAFPYSVISKAQLASGEIVEDMKLGLDLAIQGEKVKFLHEHLVESVLPTDQASMQTQRQRWEHGHLGLIQRMAGGLLVAAIKKASLPLLLLFCDLIIPPLSLLIVLAVAIWGVGVALFIFGLIGFSTLLISTSLCILLVISLIFAWYRHGRELISASELSKFPFYVLGKLGSYFKFISNRETKWIKTKRD